MNFRTDSEYYATCKVFACNDDGTLKATAEADLAFLSAEDRAATLATDLPKPGDTWRLEWHSGPFAGYAICCPKCKRIHHWDSANNCADGVINGICKHRRTEDGGQLGSCWVWSGSAEDNSLSAQPSLHVSLGCGWHGWLTNGVLTEC